MLQWFALRFAGYPLMLITIIVLAIGIIRSPSSLSHNSALRDNRDELLRTVKRLEVEVDTLEGEISSIKSSSAYARKVLKGKYHITQKNEQILFFADEQE